MTSPMIQFLQALAFNPQAPLIFVLAREKSVITRWGYATEETEAAMRSANADGWNIFVTINAFSVWSQGKVWVKVMKNYSTAKHSVDLLVDWAEGQFKMPSRRAWAMDIPQAVWVDVDNPDAPGGGNGTWPEDVPRPSISVESSPGKRQHYWLLHPDDIHTNKGHQRHDNKAFTEALGGDPAVVDAARILRVPGFMNWKYDPAPEVKLLHLDANRRFKLPLLTKAKPTPPTKRPLPDGPGWVIVDPSDTAVLERVENELGRIRYALEHNTLLFGASANVKALGQGSDNRIFRAANAVADWTVNVGPDQQVEAIYAFLEPWFLAGEGESDDKGNTDYLRQKIEHALRYRHRLVGEKAARL